MGGCEYAYVWLELWTYQVKQQFHHVFIHEILGVVYQYFAICSFQTGAVRTEHLSLVARSMVYFQTWAVKMKCTGSLPYSPISNNNNNNNKYPHRGACLCSSEVIIMISKIINNIPVRLYLSSDFTISIKVSPLLLGPRRFRSCFSHFMFLSRHVSCDLWWSTSQSLVSFKTRIRTVLLDKFYA